MQQGRGGGILLEVGRVGDDESPIGDIPHGGEEIATQPVPNHIGGEGHGIPGHEDHDWDERRKQPTGPPKPEVGQVHAPGHLMLAQEQGGDEEARQDEEDIDAEEATRQPVHPAVVEQHTQDGQRADAIQTRPVRQAPARVRRHTQALRGKRGDSR